MVSTSSPTKSDLYASFLSSILSPLKPYLEDATVSEIMIHSHQGVFVESTGRIAHCEKGPFSSKRLDAFVQNHAESIGRHFSPLEHSYDGVLPCGSRFHVIWPPATSDGAYHMTIRKHHYQDFGLEDLRDSMFSSAEDFERLKTHIVQKSNIVLSGETGTGKTTLLNAILDQVEKEERVVIIEEIPEIAMESHDNKALLTTVPPDKHGRGGKTIRDLVRESLIMRPDRIILGECRGTEAVDLLQAMQTHRGCLATVHGRDIDNAIYRLETLLLLGQTNYTSDVAAREIASGVDLFVQLQRDRNGRRYVAAMRESSLRQSSK